MTERIAKALRSIDLFAGLPDPLLNELVAFSLLRQIRAGETIFCQGEPSPYCFGVVTGQISIQRVPREKNFPSKTLGVLGPGALFGEQALFKDNPRTAMAVASQNGELVAIQGKKFRQWLDQNEGVGLKLLMGMLESSLVRLRRTSHELSLVYGVGRALAGDRPFLDRLRETAQFLRASLEDIDDIQVYQRSPYWDEFEPVSGGAMDPPGEPAAFPIKHPYIETLTLTAAPIVIPREGKTGVIALIPLMDSADSHQTIQGFLWVASRNPDVFTANLFLLLTTVAVQFSEALTRQARQDDAEAHSRLDQKKQFFNL
jgi:CRP-like cAMP-binding protein